MALFSPFLFRKTQLCFMALLILMYSCQSDDKLAKDNQTTGMDDTVLGSAAKHDSIHQISVSKPDKAKGDARSTSKVIMMPESDIVSCDKAAEALFLSSDKVQDLLKQKTTKYSMEYRPGDEGNTSKRYCFWVFAAPSKSASAETYGRYQVDAHSGQLYENDPVADNYHPVASNASLKKYLGKFCK
jgi:hypothetical protein